MADNVSIDFDFSSFNGKLDELWQAVLTLIDPAVFLAGEALRADSVQIVPFDKGFNGGLAGSSSTEKSVRESDTVISATVGYNKVYAAKLHEDMTLHIKQTHAVAGQPRQQKYLEKPARENAQKYGKMLNDSLSSLLK